MEAKVAALSNIFPEVRMGTIIKVLNENNWQQEAAVEVLLQMTADEERNRDDANDNENTTSVSIPLAPSNLVITELNQNQNQPNRTEGIALANPPLTTPPQQQQQQQNTNTNNDVYLNNNNNNNNNASWEPMQILQDLRNYITRSEAWALSIDVLTDLKREITVGLNELMSMVKEGGLGAEEKRAKLENRLRELQEINRKYEEERASKLNTTTTTTQNPPSNNNSAPCNVTSFVQPTPNQSPVVNNVNTNTQPQPQSQSQSQSQPQPRVVPLQDFPANFAHYGFTPAYPPANYPQHNMFPSYPPVHIAQQQPYYQPHQQQPQQSPRQQQQQQQQPNLGGYPQPYYPYPYYYTQPRK